MTGRRRSLGSTWQNRIQPVTVDPTDSHGHTVSSRVAGMADIIGCADNAAGGMGNSTLPLCFENDDQVTSICGEKKSRWSLRKSFRFLRRSKSTKTPFKQFTKQMDVSVMSENASCSKEKLNKSILSCSASVDLASHIKNSDAKGALGLTPLANIFTIQTLGSRPCDGKENEDAKSVLSKKSIFAKSGHKTPKSSVSRRRVLNILNRKEESFVADISINADSSFRETPKSKRYLTRSESKRSRDINCSRQGDITDSDIQINKDQNISKLEDLQQSSYLSRSLQSLHTFSREPSPGIPSIDMSLETSIMNSLYPNGKSILDISLGSVETVLSGKSSRRQSLQSNISGTSGNIQSNRRRSNSIGTAKSDQLVSDADSFRLLVERLAEHENIPACSPSICLTSNPKANTQRLPRPLVLQKSQSQGPVMRKRKPEVTFCEDSIIHKPRKCRRKSLGAIEGISLKKEKVAACQMRRSRSMRVSQESVSIEVTGLAGHTPKPRRRHNISYNERLIM